MPTVCALARGGRGDRLLCGGSNEGYGHSGCCLASNRNACRTATPLLQRRSKLREGWVGGSHDCRGPAQLFRRQPQGSLHGPTTKQIATRRSRRASGPAAAATSVVARLPAI